MPNRSALLGHTFLERGEQFHPSPMTLTAKRYEFQRWNGLHRQLSYHSIPMLGFVAFGTEEGSDAHRPTAAMRHALMTSRLQREVSVAVRLPVGFLVPHRRALLNWPPHQRVAWTALLVFRPAHSVVKHPLFGALSAIGK